MLGGERGRNRFPGRGEGGGYAVAHLGEDDPALTINGGLEDLVVAGQGGPHGLGMVLPAGRRALDVGE